MSAFDDRVPHSELPKEKSINALLCSLLSLFRLLAVITLPDIPEKNHHLFKDDQKRYKTATKSNNKGVDSNIFIIQRHSNRMWYVINICVKHRNCLLGVVCVHTAQPKVCVGPHNGTTSRLTWSEIHSIHGLLLDGCADIIQMHKMCQHKTKTRKKNVLKMEKANIWCCSRCSRESVRGDG